MNKAKVNAYLYYQKMFIIKAQKLNEYIVKMVGFGKRMETLVNGNMKYVMDTCNTMYPEPEQGENVQENVPTDNAVKTNV
jgi:hypothetical protein